MAPWPHPCTTPHLPPQNMPYIHCRIPWRRDNITAPSLVYYSYVILYISSYNYYRWIGVDAGRNIHFWHTSDLIHGDGWVPWIPGVPQYISCNRCTVLEYNAAQHRHRHCIWRLLRRVSMVNRGRTAEFVAVHNRCAPNSQ